MRRRCTPAPAARRLGPAGLMAGILLVCSLVTWSFWPALLAQAVGFDDDQYFLENPLVQEPSLAALSLFWGEVLRPSTVTSYYQPLTMTSLAADRWLSGERWLLDQVHRTNLGLHLAATATLAALLWLITERVGASLGVALLFGVHPVAAEAVVWGSQRKTLLAGLCCLMALIAWVIAARRRAAAWRFASLACYLAALLSKPTAIALPVVLLLMDRWPLHRWRSQVTWRVRFRETLPFFLLAGFFSAITVVSQGSRGGLELPSAVRSPADLLLALSNLGFYLRQSFVPVDMTAHVHLPDQLAAKALLPSAGLVVAVVAGAVVARRSTPAPWVALLILAGLLLPVLGFFRYTNVAAANHYLYLPLIGPALLVAGGLARVRRRRAMLVCGLATILAAGGLVVQSRLYLEDWRNSERLYRSMLVHAPTSPYLHLNLGVVLQQKGQLAAAEASLARAVELDPELHLAQRGLGMVLLLRGRPREAEHHLREALRLAGEDAQAYLDLGRAQLARGRLADAARSFERAAQLAPEQAQAWSLSGACALEMGRPERAVRHLEMAWRLAPDDPLISANLGTAYLRLGRNEAAAAVWRAGLERRPDDPLLRRSLMVALSRIGKSASP